MQAPNILTMEYFQNAARIADLLNAFHFHGEQIVMPENVEEKSEIQNMFFNYSFHLLDVRRFSHIEYFRTDLQWVFGFLQNSEDPKKLSAYVNAQSHEFETLAEDAYDLICELSDARILKKLKNKHEKHEGGVNMCKGLQGIYDEGQKQGIELGIELAQKVFNLYQKRCSYEYIAKKCNISIKKVKYIIGHTAA